MGLLANGKDKTLSYNDSRKYQRLLKKIAALQITKLMKTFLNFKNTEENRIKYGIEQEFHLITSFEYQRKTEKKDFQKMTSIPTLEKHKEYSVSLGIKDFLKQVPESVKDQVEIMPEFAGWVMEIVPKSPFVDFLSKKEIMGHLKTVDAMNIKSKTHDSESNPNKTFLLSTSIFPKIGYADYYIRPNGERIPYVEREESNEFSRSKYYIDETVSKHVRFPTLTRNTMLRKGDRVEINVPLFVDKNTKIRCENLYKDSEEYKDVPYKMEDQIIQEFKKQGKVGIQLFLD